MKKTINAVQVFRVLLGLAVIEGLIANLIYFQSPSESQNAFLWGYSLQRLAIGAFSLLFLAVFVGLLILSFTSRETVIKRLQGLFDSFTSPTRRIIFLLPLAIILALDLGINLVYAFPELLRFVPFIVVKRSLLLQTGMVPIWAFLLPLQLWAFLFSLKFLVFGLVFGLARGAQGQTGQDKLTLPGRLTLLAVTAAATVLALSVIWGLIFGNILAVVLTGPAGKLVILALWFLVWLAVAQKNADWATRQLKGLISLSVWLVTFLVATQLTQWMDSLNTPILNYWNLLAEAFLRGQAYLSNPVSTFDITSYNGRWYVPAPPLPAIMLMPFIAIWGVGAFNTTLFSLVVSSTTSVFLYLILEELSQHKWIKLSRSGILWLVALFAFGTVELWLSTSSVLWFFTQICTIFFAAAAFLAALKRFPPWVTGLLLAFSILGRPNEFVLWPALVLITLQIQLDMNGNFSWRRLLTWATWSAIPVFLSVGFLLYYNYLRFGNFFDFGYVTVNGPAWIIRRVQEYGMFNLYFLPGNVQTMLLALPELKAKCEYYFPRGNGLSLFATTPALFYVFRRFKFSWWLLGCWISSLLALALLLMYHNNGSVQIAYRYMLDFAIPLMMVLAFTAGERISGLLKALIVLSFGSSYYAIISWFHGPC